MINFLESKFSFFKAGQGAFYGGVIKNPSNNKQYTVVYDCGTVSKQEYIEREIREFKDNYSSKGVIDLLFISHLDKDHVSGLEMLLNEFDVKRIILPYLIKEQRLPSLLSFNEDIPIDERDINNYSLFLESPWNYIREHSENTDIILIDANKDGNYLSYNNESLSDDLYIVGTLIEDLDTDDYNEISNISNLYLYKNNLQFYILNIWEFTTHVKNINDSSKITNLHNDLKKLINKENHDELNIDNLKQLLRNRDLRSKAKKCYNDIFKDVNKYSLILLHGPINYTVLNSVVIESNNHITPYCYHDNSSRLYTILLGDSNIKGKYSKELIEKFKDKLENVHVFQVPHHGSKNNWNTEKFEDLKIGMKCQPHNPFFAICNFKESFKNKYPCEGIKDKFKSNLLLNTEYNRIVIAHQIYFSSNPLFLKCSHCYHEIIISDKNFVNKNVNYNFKKWYE